MVELIAAALTPGQRRVAAGIVNGDSNTEIAASLHVSVNTIKHMLSLVYRKFGFSEYDWGGKRVRLIYEITRYE
jgi:DNA-binding NarL/FixJ family response regulator